MNERRTYQVTFSKAEVIAALRAFFPTTLMVQVIPTSAATDAYPTKIPNGVSFTWTKGVSPVIQGEPEVVVDDDAEVA